MSGLKLFNTKGGVTEIVPSLADVEADVQRLFEADMEMLLGFHFLASEYSTGLVHGGRIDSLGLDASGSPVVVEYKSSTDAGVVNQGLFYLSWLMDHRVEFECLVRERIGAMAAAQVLWSGPRLICIAGDFTRYDALAVREHRRGGVLQVSQGRAGAMEELAEAVGEALLSLGDVNCVQRRQYRAYQRLRNFACFCPPQRTKLLVYVKVDPQKLDLVPGFTRHVTELGHHGTGDLEVHLRVELELERALDLFCEGYAAA
ncbi:transporter [Streptomyces sp. NBC_01237]|uniref:transporter n=1 Tax=Streptomyces sp. NBC_01237 TaxID=2903790 RepID=UPI002DDC0C85|nr:transporter [Streptomyces sp. NBC_01237]WRZ77621.1 transporter [Streptomyces sp. NBC_01237]